MDLFGEKKLPSIKIWSISLNANISRFFFKLFLQYFLERNVQNIAIEYAEVVFCWFLLRSIVFQKVNQNVKFMELEVFFVVHKQFNILQISLDVNQFVFYSCVIIRLVINLLRSLNTLEESSILAFWMKGWGNDCFNC